MNQLYANAITQVLNARRDDKATGAKYYQVTGYPSIQITMSRASILENGFIELFKSDNKFFDEKTFRMACQDDVPNRTSIVDHPYHGFVQPPYDD